MQAGEGGGFEDWEVTFLPWYWQDEYKREVPEGFVLDDYESFVYECHKHDGLTLEHLAWRRNKLRSPEFNSDVAKFKKEYPFTLEEAFEASDEDSYIKADLVARALKTPALPHNSGLVMGIDPARLGKDRFTVIHRAGRTFLRAFLLPPGDTVQNADWLAKHFNEYQPMKAAIDTGGLGVGVYDLLKAKGFAHIILS